MEHLPPKKREYCHGCNKSVDFKLAAVQEEGQTPYYFCPEPGCAHKFYVVEGPLEERMPEQWD